MTSPVCGASAGLLTYVPWIVAIVGWYVVARQNELRERRKDIRELLNAVEQRVGGVCSDWLEFSGTEVNSREALELEAKIRFGVNSIQPLVLLINDAGLECNVTGNIVLFRQEVTGVDFESVTRKVSDFDPARFGMISLIGMDLVRSLELTYFATYPMKFSDYVRRRIALPRKAS